MVNPSITSSTLLNKYTITRKFKSTNTYTFYKCEYKNSEYLAKVHKNAAFYKSKLKFYHNFANPGIVTVVEFGFENDSFIEIFPFIGGENIFNNAKNNGLNHEYIIEVLIPVINRALNALHQENVVHGSVFPFNMFYINRRKDIALSFPILDQPFERINEFMAKEVSEDNFLPASDYYAFGICILYFLLGYEGFYKLVNQGDLFNHYLTPSLIPASVPPEYHEIIAGLTNMYPEKRWGFEEVENWLTQLDKSDEVVIEGFSKVVESDYEQEDEFIEEMEEEEAPPSETFYVQNYLDNLHSLDELREGILLEWNQIKHFIPVLKDYVLKFQPTLEEDLNLIGEIENKDYALFKMLELIKTTNGFYWRGREYSDIKALGSELEKTLPQIEESFTAFVTSGCFIDLLEKTKMTEKKRKKASKIQSLMQTDQILALYKLSYMLTEKRSFTFEYGTAETIADFINLLHKNKANITSISTKLLKDKQFLAWIGHKGYDTYIEHWEKTVNAKNI